MKKITRHRRELDRLQSYRNRTQRGNKFGGRNSVTHESTKEKLIAPREFRLLNESSRNSLFHLTNRAKYALRNGKIVSIQLKHVEKLYPCATLFFCAHIETLIDEYPGKVQLDYPENKVVCQLFQHIGLLGKAGLSATHEIDDAAVKDWYYIRGNSTDISGFVDLFENYKLKLASQVSMTLAGSMSEAVTNCVHHAYPKTNGEPVKWWMFSELRYHPELSEHHLTIVIFDLGIGIAKSLRQKPTLSESISKRFASQIKHDQRLLANAVGSTRTTTKLPYRGKGLPEMLENVKSNDDGGLLIHSNYGSFLYNASSKVEKSSPYGMPLDGTLIQWMVPIKDEVESAKQDDCNS